MKLTWFAGTTIRIHIGGKILVADADRAPGFVDSRELVSGADQVFAMVGTGLPGLDPARWRSRQVPRMIDETGQPPEIGLHRLAEGAVLVDAAGEPAVVLVTGDRPPVFGRWADGTVVVLFGSGEAMVATATRLLDTARPRLIALAAGEPEVDFAVTALRNRLDGVALVSLEPGFALEV